MERKYFESSIGKLSYIEKEGKNKIIFLHGLGGTGNSWTKIAPYLREDFNLYLLDLIGHGHSDKPEIDYTLEIQVKVLREFIEAKDMKNYILMGNSYGGWVSLKYSIEIEEPAKLVLEDSAGINVTYGEVSEEVRNAFINNIVSSNSFNSRHVIESIVINNSQPRWKIKDEELRKLNAQTLIIWGSDDQIIDISYGERLHSLISNSKFIKIDGGGHTPHIKKPREVANILNTFV